MRVFLSWPCSFSPLEKTNRSCDGCRIPTTTQWCAIFQRTVSRQRWHGGAKHHVRHHLPSPTTPGQTTDNIKTLWNRGKDHMQIIPAISIDLASNFETNHSYLMVETFISVIYLWHKLVLYLMVETFISVIYLWHNWFYTGDINRPHTVR